MTKFELFFSDDFMVELQEAKNETEIRGDGYPLAWDQFLKGAIRDYVYRTVAKGKNKT